MILGIDTSMGTAVALVGEDGALIAERHSDDVRGHAEAIGELIAAVLAEARASGPATVTGVAVGMGPGPYTGLRVGVAAAEAFAFGRGIPLHGVPSHDAIRSGLGLAPSIPVATPAGRRGHYLSEGGELELTHDGVGQGALAEALLAERVPAAEVARVALARRKAGRPTGPDAPIYLRAPDVSPPKARP